MRSIIKALLLFLLALTEAQTPASEDSTMGGSFGMGSSSGALSSLTSLFGGGAAKGSTPKGSTAPTSASSSSNSNIDIGALLCQTTTGTGTMSNMMISAVGGVKDGKPLCDEDNTGGSGPFKANWTSDLSLPEHTIFAPLTPPAEKLPVLIWGNGGCQATGTLFKNLLTEISSYGFIILANGAPKGMGTSKVSDLTKSIDWAFENPAAKKYGNLDTSRLVVMGQSCGGLEAYSASYKDPRVKLTVLFNSGTLDDSKRSMIQQLKAPVAFFSGGPTDMAFSGVCFSNLIS
jgi:hypothetical protein